MNSIPARAHTEYGKAYAQRDATWEHRMGHTDARGEQHIDAECRLCMADYWLAKRQQETNGLAS